MGARVAAKLNERLLLRRRLPQLLELFDRSRCKSRIVIVRRWRACAMLVVVWLCAPFTLECQLHLSALSGL